MRAALEADAERGGQDMMFSGIGGLVGAIVARILMSDAGAVHWMLYGLWAVVAICGAIRRDKRGD